jgi:hypothetical protein
MSSPTCFELNCSNSLRVCALTFSPIFIALMLYLLTRMPSTGSYPWPLHHYLIVWFGLEDTTLKLNFRHGTGMSLIP